MEVEALLVLRLGDAAGEHAECGDECAATSRGRHDALRVGREATTRRQRGTSRVLSPLAVGVRGMRGYETLEGTMASTRAVAGIAWLVALAALAGGGTGERGAGRAAGAGRQRARSRLPRQAARAGGALSRPAPRADAALRGQPAQSRRAQRVAEAEFGAQGQRAAEGGRQGRLRAELRGAGSFPAGGRLHGRQPDLDLATGRGVRGRSRGGVRRHPAPAEAEPGGGQPEDHAPADRGDADHAGRRAGDRHRAGEPPGGLRAAVQPAGGVHAAGHHDRHRAGGRRRRERPRP